MGPSVVVASCFCERQTMSWVGLMSATCRRGEGDEDLTGVDNAWKHEVAAIVRSENGGDGGGECGNGGKGKKLRERIGEKWMRRR